MTLRELVSSFFDPYRSHRSRTVRYAFPLVFLVAALLSAATIVSTDHTTIDIVPSQTTVKAGDQFSLRVYVQAAVPVNAVDLAVTFPPSTIKINGIDTGESVITLWTKQPYVKNNTVVLRGGTFNRGFTGKHLIATINATAEDSGLATFSIPQPTLLAGDGSGSRVTVGNNGHDGTQLFITKADGSMQVSSSTNAGVSGNVRVGIVPDINGDGKVTLSDVSQFMSAWASNSKVYDFSGDGKMTFTDFAIILADAFFGQTSKQ